MSRSAILDGRRDDRYHVESAARTIELLQLFARHDGPVVLRTVLEELGCSKAVAYRLVRTLENCGALRHAPGSGYLLGPTMLAIGDAAARSLSLPDIAMPYLEALNRKVHETVNVSVLDGSDILYVQRVEDTQLLGIRVSIGSRLPACCTSMGQVLLAALPDEEVERRLASQSFGSFGPNAPRSLAEVLERLSVAREQGYAINDEELAAGHRAASAPVHDHTGEVIAAVNVSIPGARISLEEMRARIVPALIETTIAISADLGAPERADV